MKSRDRLLKVLNGEIPDCVPVAPDFSNMIPAKMTGRPFWDVYLYNQPAHWKAYINCAKYFNIDSLMDGYFPLKFPEELINQPNWEQYIVYQNNERIVVQNAYKENGKLVWNNNVTVYYVADSPSRDINPESIGLSKIPSNWNPVEIENKIDRSPQGFAECKNALGNQGLLGTFLTHSCALSNEEDIFRYYDNPKMHEKWAQERVDAVDKRFGLIMEMDVKPDFLCVGGSGTLIFQTPEIFRQLALPAVKHAIKLATNAGFYTHIHSCGPEKELVKIMAEETSLSVIDPLEIPPMGNCNLAELKKLYGDKIVLKGNIHTTDIMLNGTVDDVVEASKKAIDDTAEGGRFILSTGDQCGRDTPEENLFAMIETARTYGKY